MQRADRYESLAASKCSAVSQAHSTSSKWLSPSAGGRGRGWSNGQLWKMSKMKEGVTVMLVKDDNGVALGHNPLHSDVACLTLRLYISLSC